MIGFLFVLLVVDFMPDNSCVAFTAFYRNSWDVFVKRDSNIDQITFTNYDERSISISSDYMNMVYCISDGSLWIININTLIKSKLDLPDGYYNHPIWSLDGKSIYFTSFTFKGPTWERGDIWKYDLETKKIDKKLSQTGTQLHQTLDSKGNIIYSLAIFGPSYQTTHQLWKYDISTNKAKQLLLTEANDIQPSVSPDDEKIAFSSDRSGNYDIWIMDYDGTDLKKLTSHQSADTDPVFSPDGKKILFVSERTGIHELWLIDIESNNIEKLEIFKDTPCEVIDPDWR